MIVNFFKIFTEYAGIIVCVHKAVRKKIKFDWINLFDFALYMILIFVLESISFGKIVIYVYWFLYIRMRIAETWKQTVKPFAIMMCAIPMLQLMIYTITARKMVGLVGVCLLMVIINILIIIFFLIWKREYLFILMNIVTKHRKVIFALLLIMLMVYLILYFSEYRTIKSYYMDQIAIYFLFIALVLILWINSENEKRHKAEELRAYQLYTKTFEDAVTTIRMKQHEFDNHINAIKCMRYTIQNKEELFDEQDKYCNRILQDNKYNKLLKLNMSPILTGYLYSKFTAASAHDINITYEIQDVNIEYIVINDLIEIIGVLFDNAVEALREQGDTEMEVKLLKTDDAFMLSVANISGWKTNNEIEKFFEYGYSTKGREHGIGLYRVNTLLKKYKASIQAENITKNDMNYLYFKVIF